MEVKPEIHQIVSHRHEVARKWKAKTGGKVMGYLSIDIPEELIYAAGVLPVRILGSHEPEVITDPYMWNMMHCVFERDCLAQGLEGRYDYLDGIVNETANPHAKQCLHSWIRHVPIGFSHEFYVPVALNRPYALPCLRGEVGDFKHVLEKWTGKTISDNAIDHAIEVYNTSRRLMTELSELRKSRNPRISGAEFMEIALAGMLTDKQQFNDLLKPIVKEVSQRQVKNEGSVRIMLAGGANDHLDLVKSIETMGAAVVVDDHSTGGRYYTTEVVPEKDNLNALATRMVRKPRSPLHDLPNRTRDKYLVELAKEYRAEGVIFMIQMHDDAEQFDLPHNTASLAENDIPTLMLELDFTNPIEQFRTRVEAFLETIEAKNAVTSSR